MQMRILFFLIVAVLVSAFALANPTSVDINLIFWQINSVSLALVILICLLVGASLVWLFSTFEIVAKNIRLKQLENRLKQLEPKTTGENTDEN